MNYTVNDLTTLTSGEAFRAKVGMYLSADLQEAINLGLRELIVNAQDEYEVYRPADAKVKINIDTERRVISVEDNLRGIPVGVRDDGINSLEAAFLLPHSGAKHQEGAYTSSIGTNGIGNKIVCHTAEWLFVRVYRDGKEYTLSFKSNDKGAYIDKSIETKILKNNKLTGTYIEYKPDEKVYKNNFIDIENLQKMLFELSLFAKGLRIILVVDGFSQEFYSKNGLIDGINSVNKLSSPFSYFYETDSCQVELALQWVSKGGNVKGYANGLFMPDGGAFMTAFKTAVTRQFNLLAKKRFDGDRIRNCLTGYCSVKVKTGQFTNQQKTALANPETREPVSRAVAESFAKFFKEQKNIFDSIVQLLEKIDKAELAAERARVAILQGTKDIEKTQKKKVFESAKLKDATKLGQDSILLLVEGDSAASSMTNARDYTKYGVLALRGKLINALSNPEEKIFNNNEVRLFLSAMGISPSNYNPNKLRYGKVAICVDGDSDGYHISLLIMSLIHKIVPQFLEEGRLLWLQAPLYRVINKDRSYYYYNDDELRKGVKGEQTRFKGLGELGVEDTKNSMFSEQQRLVTLQYSKEGVRRLEELMSESVEFRKEFVMNNIDFSLLER